MTQRTLGLALALVVASTSSAIAVPHVYKHDQFGEALEQAANDVNGQSLATQPGFVQTEAFGSLYRPAPEHYPLKIEGVDLILAAPPNAPNLETHAQIEIWNSTAGGPDPGTGSPMFQISTTELFNLDAGDFGVPLKGNVGMKIDFDYNDPDGHPDLITSGNIWVMIRFTSAASSMEAEWDTIQCLQVPGLTCGCQVVGTINDFATTPQANVLHHVSPLGQCSGSLAWSYADQAGVTGDFLLRVRAEVNGTACVTDCAGKSCGSDGCGGSCGSCQSDEVCNAGACEPFCLADCAGKNCGGDGCGGTCGSCSGEQTCTNGVCTGDGACNPPCQAGQTCNNGVCEGCTPDCTGANCGDDGCGGSCGSCSAGQTCTGKICAGAAGDLSIIEISPRAGEVGDYVDVAITGTGFQQGLNVLVGGKDLAGIKVVGDSLIQAQVPGDVPVGVHSVIVSTPDGKVATLTDGYEALAAANSTCGNGVCQVAEGETNISCPQDCQGTSSTSGGCSCQSGHGEAPLDVAVVVLAVLLALVARRRRFQPQSAHPDR